MNPEDTPEGWHSFAAALPPNLYARLVARAEREGADVLLETAYLLAYALDNAPSPSEATVRNDLKSTADYSAVETPARTIGKGDTSPDDDDKNPQETG